MRKGRLAARVLLGLLLVCVTAFNVCGLWYAYSSRKFVALDFRVYYVAVSFFDGHVSPYTRVPGNPAFVYTPVSLLLLKCFTVYRQYQAQTQWMAVKCLAGFLVVLILHSQMRLRRGLLQGLLIAGGFTFAVVADLVGGNVALIEQLAVWAGFAAMLKRRYLLFGICLVIAAQFKLTFIALLPCVFLIEGGQEERRRQWIAVAAGAGMFLLTLFVNFLLWPSWVPELRRNLAAIDYDGAAYDPCMRAFIYDAVQALRIGGAAGLVLTILATATVLIVSGRAILAYRQRVETTDTTLLILFVCVVYALVMPRLKLYSYVMVIPPAMLLASRVRSWREAAVLALCFVPIRRAAYPYHQVPQAIARFCDAAHVPPLVQPYTSLFALFAIWLWYVRELHNAGAPGESRIIGASAGNALGDRVGVESVHACVTRRSPMGTAWWNALAVASWRQSADLVASRGRQETNTP